MTEQRNQPLDFPLALVDSANPGSFKVDPTIEAGDFQVSTDFGAFADLATLPVVMPAGSIQVKVSLSAAEMNGPYSLISGIDVAGGEWDDVLVEIRTEEGALADIIDLLTNNAVVTPEQGGSGRVVTIFEDDGTTVKSRVLISADGLTRTKIP